MVKRSTEDYGQWKKDVRRYYIELGVKKSSVDNFMGYVSSIYDKHNRSYIPFKLMWYLYDRRNWVEKENQHYWVAFIGRIGGEGKTTLGEHCLSFMDKTFTPDRKPLNYDSFINIIKKAIKKTDYPAVLLDEPENKLHPLSERGRELRDILGKVRQLNMFIGVCANSLGDIPSFIFHRLSAVFYLNNKHRFWLYDSVKDKPKHTILEDIKKGFSRYGHGIFLDKKTIKRAFLKNQGFSKDTVFDEGNYIKRKMADLMTNINSYVGVSPKQKEKDDRDKNIFQRWKSKKFTQQQIADYEGLSRRQIIKICKKYSEKVNLNSAESI